MSDYKSARMIPIMKEYLPILLLASTLLLSGCIQGTPSQEDVMEKLRPELITYCEGLESKAQLNEGYCPTCYNYINSSIPHFDQSLSNLSISRDGDTTAVNVTIRLIYDWRNDKPSSNRLGFTLGEDGSVIGRNIPEKRCV
jgi:hypothetical protein